MDVSEAFARADKAVKRLADPNLSPRRLLRAVVDASIATEMLADALGAYPHSEMAANARAFETAVAESNARAVAFRDHIANCRAQGARRVAR